MAKKKRKKSSSASSFTKVSDDREEKEEFQAEAPANEDFGEVLAAWEIPEFIRPERKKIWYLLFGIIIIALLAYSYFSRNPLFALIILLFLIIYFVHERRPSNNLGFALVEDGVIVGQKLIAYSNLENFYIIYYPPKIKNLYLQPKNNFKPLISIPLLNQDPVIIRKILLEYLPEDLAKEEIPTSESISGILKL